MKQQPKIAELLKRIETSKQQDIELGSYEIYVFSENELEKGQIGYRYDKHKNSLISEESGKRNGLLSDMKRIWGILFS